jgi:gas vesicle protein
MKTTQLLLVVLGAAAAGVVAGLLIAPDKGSETRKKIGQSAEDLKNKASELIKTGKEYVNDLTNAIKQETPNVES